MVIIYEYVDLNVLEIDFLIHLWIPIESYATDNRQQTKFNQNRTSKNVWRSRLILRSKLKHQKFVRLINIITLTHQSKDHSIHYPRKFICVGRTQYGPGVSVWGRFNRIAAMT